MKDRHEFVRAHVIQLAAPKTMKIEMKENIHS
jgi:hypothetical protein